MLKPDAPELDIVAHAQMDATLSAEALAKRCRQPTHVVRYALRKLIRSRKILKVGAIDFSALGLQETIIRFSSAERNAASQNKFLDALIDSQRVQWLVGCGGFFSYAMSVLTRTQYELLEYLEELSNRFGCVFDSKSLSLVAENVYWGRRYLAPNCDIGKPVHLQTKRCLASPDLQTHNLLRVLSKDYSASINSVAGKLNIPFSTAAYQIRRLQQQGVIARYLYTWDLSHLPLSRYYMFIKTRSNGEMATRYMRELASDYSIVIGMLRGLGDWDYALRIESYSNQLVYELQQEIYRKYSGLIVSLDTTAVLKLLKVSNYPLRDYRAIYGCD